MVSVVSGARLCASTSSPYASGTPTTGVGRHDDLVAEVDRAQAQAEHADVERDPAGDDGGDAEGSQQRVQVGPGERGHAVSPHRHQIARGVAELGQRRDRIGELEHLRRVLGEHRDHRRVERRPTPIGSPLDLCVHDRDAVGAGRVDEHAAALQGAPSRRRGGQCLHVAEVTDDPSLQLHRDDRGRGGGWQGSWHRVRVPVGNGALWGTMADVSHDPLAPPAGDPSDRPLPLGLLRDVGLPLVLASGSALPGVDARRRRGRSRRGAVGVDRPARASTSERSTTSSTSSTRRSSPPCWPGRRPTAVAPRHPDSLVLAGDQVGVVSIDGRRCS